MSASVLTSAQVAPASSDRNRPPPLASTIAYTRFGSAPETLTSILPTGPAGRPRRLVSSVQVVPPSVDLNSPLPGPPSSSSQNLRAACHIAAERTFGLDGSIDRST